MSPFSDGEADIGSTSAGPFSTHGSSLVEDAAQASAVDDDTRAAALAEEALSLWHGPVLAGIPLHLDGRAEAERLDEFRSRALEIRVDAELALGRHAEVVGELRWLVEENRYRERLVAQLMIALYRSGRHAEALEVYEQTRRPRRGTRPPTQRGAPASRGKDRSPGAAASDPARRAQSPRISGRRAGRER